MHWCKQADKKKKEKNEHIEWKGVHKNDVENHESMSTVVFNGRLTQF